MKHIKEITKKINMKRMGLMTLGFNVIWSTIAYADQVDKISQILAQYAAKGGGIVAFIGAILAASGYKSDNPSEMERGIKTVIAGVIVVVIAKGYTSWIN